MIGLNNQVRCTDWVDSTWERARKTRTPATAAKSVTDSAMPKPCISQMALVNTLNEEEYVTDKDKEGAKRAQKQIYAGETQIK